MNNNLKFIIFIFISFIISFALMMMKTNTNRYYDAVKAYRVYLDGKSMGLIKSEKELANYINKDQQLIKEKYNVKNVYLPDGLEVKEEITYSDEIENTVDIYNEIKEKASFTIKGYEIVLTKQERLEIGDDKNEEDLTSKTYIYVLDVNIFKNAVNKVVKSFVDEEQYEKYLANNQDQILTTGSIIENVYIEDDFVIKEKLIPANKVIFIDEDTLTTYLLFGTTEKQKTYKVKDKDTVESIANTNKVSVNEFLIANPNITSADALLYKGQEVVIGLINPKFVVIEEKQIVNNEKLLYQTESRYNNDLGMGVVRIIREGEYGSAIVTKNIKYANGDIDDAKIVSTEITKEAVNRIVEKNSKTTYVVGSGVWKWPTKIPYNISSYLGWRRGRYHEGLDITVGFGSPIYAANDGTVQAAGWNGAYGLRVVINHNNGYKTVYAHLSKAYVKTGQGIEMGQVIGAMGNTGRSTGTHLHFEVHYNGEIINPLRLY